MKFPTWLLLIALSSSAVSACAHSTRQPLAAAQSGLNLQRVVLYRNGVGYFERQGLVQGDVLTIKVRKDQVNDLLKSLTVVERTTGKAVSISMPLDPQSWADVAFAAQQTHTGNLAQVLDSLRGTYVDVKSSEGNASGRIVVIEELINEPKPEPKFASSRYPMPVSTGENRDHKLTLIDGQKLITVRLSSIRSITLKDKNLALHIHRHLDADAGEGMFQQVAIDIRLAGAKSHQLAVSYVVETPMWKPTYRVVLAEDGKGQTLLQGWAVVDNVSGEDWNKVQMNLTSGAPIAFRYDLHTPRPVNRVDLTEQGVRKRAQAVVGETSMVADAVAEEQLAPEPEMEVTEADAYAADESSVASVSGRLSRSQPKKKAYKESADKDLRGAGGFALGAASLEQGPTSAPTLDYESLRRSTLANARAQQISGLTHFSLKDVVTVPNGTSTMVALINEPVQAEETFLYRPGGAGIGYEMNPYRVIRFKNTTPFVLEPGPISIYKQGSFVGEGLAEAIGSQSSATIPFAVEPEIIVSSQVQHRGDEMRLTKISRGVLEIESFQQTKTQWNIQGQKQGPFKVLIRHPKQGSNYVLKERPDATEDLPDAYLVPILVAPAKTKASIEVIEQTPSVFSITIWDQRAPDLLVNMLETTTLDARQREQLKPLIVLRQEIGKIDTQINGLQRQQQELDRRAEETRRNLEAIKRDPKASSLRAKLGERLDQFTREADAIAREIVELNSKRLEKRIELEDAMQQVDMTIPVSPETKNTEKLGK